MAKSLGNKYIPTFYNLAIECCDLMYITNGVKVDHDVLHFSRPPNCIAYIHKIIGHMEIIIELIMITKGAWHMRPMIMRWHAYSAKAIRVLPDIITL
jgi:hypothetical protein